MNADVEGAKAETKAGVPETQSKVVRWWEEKAFLAAVPFIGYFFAYQYEQGFCSAFGVPAFLLQVELVNVLAFCGILIAYSVILLQALEICFEFGDGASMPWIKFLKRLSPTIAIALLLFFFGAPWTVWFLLLFFSVPYFLGELLFIIIHRDRKRKVIEHLAEGDIFIMDKKSPFGFIHRRLGRIASASFLIIFTGSILAAQIGRFQARNSKNFLVPLSETNAVVVRKYGDKLLCATFDPTTHKLNKQLLIIPTASERGLKLEEKEIKLNFE